VSVEGSTLANTKDLLQENESETTVIIHAHTLQSVHIGRPQWAPSSDSRRELVTIVGIDVWCPGCHGMTSGFQAAEMSLVCQAKKTRSWARFRVATSRIKILWITCTKQGQPKDSRQGVIESFAIPKARNSKLQTPRNASRKA
jgi:hypothetical protein